MPKPQPVMFEINWNGCLKCGACVGVCPQPPGFTTPFDTIAVNTPCDIVCMACDKICPVSAITVHPVAVAAAAHKAVL